VSLGNHKNVTLDRFIYNTGLDIQHETVRTPKTHTALGVIIMPHQSHFEKPSNYYHALIHEAMHCQSSELGQNATLQNALIVYKSQIGMKPDITEIVSRVEKHGAAYINDPANKPAKDVALAYLHQELKCEVVTMEILHKAGLRPDEKDLAHAKNIGRLAETVYSWAGLSIRENAHKPEMLKEYNDLLNSVTKELKKQSS
jgi:antirestriction protein ArdC